METYVDLFISVDGQKISTIHSKIIEMGFKPTIGEHDFIYSWKGIVTIDEEIKFIEKSIPHTLQPRLINFSARLPVPMPRSRIRIPGRGAAPWTTWQSTSS